MQRVANYGSFLQAYGLRRLLEERGCEVVFIDYRSGKPVVPYSRLRALLYDIKRMIPFEPVTDRIQYSILGRRPFWIEYRLKYLPLLGVGSRYRYHEDVDAVVIGSDEVFNCLQNNKRVGFTPMLFGQDLGGARVISYAASFGYTTPEGLEKAGVKETVAGWLKSFQALSVRDRNSFETIRSLTGITPQQHLDPVLMADFDLPEVSLPFDRYCLLYTYGNRPYTQEEKQAILTFCGNNGLELVSIGDVQSWVPHTMTADPFEMLACFSKASFVITDTFHGTVFSNKLNCNFVTRIRPDNRQKLGDLLEKLGQTGRLIENYDHLQEYYDDPPSFNETNRIIAGERERTRAYLRENL